MLVQECVRRTLDEFSPGPIRVVSICAGQGHDLLGVLTQHSRRTDVAALLVEIDSRNVALARRAATKAGLTNVDVREGDAALTDQYAHMAPVDLVLMCGVFGNISPDDIQRTVIHCAQLCKPGGVLVWTRNRRQPDLVPRICNWLREQEFEQLWLSDKGKEYCVGSHRYLGPPQQLQTGVRLFTFLPDKVPK
ncbi:MAG TPA: class I SAM-dependent methyltransferase [Mycobacteriales bacterium]|nr:class I SAM-dependent methyltransferase [Mycobacteriales bacterium]